jgi:opacity protein-like surface antigen
VELEFGLTWNITPEVGIQGDMHDRLGGPERSSISAGARGRYGIGQHRQQSPVHTGTFDWCTPRLAANERALPIGVYALGGGGIYHRLIQLTTPSVGYTSVCDPYWYICYPTLVPVDRIIGDRTSNDFGINFGAGVTFGANAKVYVESRYHYVWGPKVTNPLTSQEVRTNAGFFPLTFGVRW